MSPPSGHSCSACVHGWEAGEGSYPFHCTSNSDSLVNAHRVHFHPTILIYIFSWHLNKLECNGSRLSEGRTWSILLKLHSSFGSTEEEADNSSICVDWWGDCNVPSNNKWRKHKHHNFIMFLICFTFVWGLTGTRLMTLSCCTFFFCIDTQLEN